MRKFAKIGGPPLRMPISAIFCRIRMSVPGSRAALVPRDPARRINPHNRTNLNIGCVSDVRRREAALRASLSLVLMPE
jgi:hypothetical protein